LQNDLTRAFDQAGLTLPDTRDGMWALMQSLDATTEAGREQIATLLRLSDTAHAYYQMLERAEEERIASLDVGAAMQYAQIVAEINRELADLDGLSDFSQSLRDIAMGLNQRVKALNDAARAAGLQGAREEDL